MKAALFTGAAVAGIALIAAAFADDMRDAAPLGGVAALDDTASETAASDTAPQSQPQPQPEPELASQPAVIDPWKIANASAAMSAAKESSAYGAHLTDMMPPGPAPAGAAAQFISGADETAPLLINHEPPPFDRWFVKALPGQSVEIGLPGGASLRADGDLVKIADGRAAWKAPDETGFHDLEVTDADGKTRLTLTAIVLEPADNFADGEENGFRMGEHPRSPPVGFVRLDEADMDRRITPHFRIGQFTCHQQPGDWPKYVAISDPMLRRLEALLISLNEDGITDAGTFYVMSGFRSPFYNYGIGATRLSRHMWGDASDIYVDVAPQDGVMDDLNGDGVLNKKDADWLYDYAEKLFAARADLPKGGVGAYGANAVHGPFVHIDGRGQMARWGR